MGPREWAHGQPTMTAPRGDASRPQEMTMTGSRATGDPHRPDDRLWMLKADEKNGS